MTEINCFISNQRSHISALMKQPLTGFTNQQRKLATWDDAAWKFTHPSGKNGIFYFITADSKASFSRTYPSSQRLPDDLRQLLMAYVIALCAERSAINTKTGQHAQARQFITALAANPANTTTSNYESAISKMKSVLFLPSFHKWLHTNAFISPALHPPKRKYGVALAGHDIIENKKNKVPHKEILFALGAIFHDVIPPEQDKWNTHPLSSQYDAFICAMIALAMSSPNRINAEQTVLAKQRLKQTTQTVDGKDATVHYLDWQGSKGYQNYHNHILAVMAEAVDRSLEYMEIVCEPARVLARFYENPTWPLRKILGNFISPDKSLNALASDMNKPIHLIHLGFLLGFYDESDGVVRVTQNTPDAVRNKSRAKHKYFKPIVDLQLEDELVVESSCPYATSLLGVKGNATSLDKIFRSYTITVAHFQHDWIQQAVSNLPGFPQGYNGTKDGQVKYNQALFCFCGKQLNSAKSSYGRSHFAIVPLSSLGSIVLSNLKPQNLTSETIFSRHGFSRNEYYINSHQLRHWLNDIADREGIPHSFINLWSGRASPEQILNYVHRTHDEKASEVTGILFNETDKEISVKVVSQQEYNELTGAATTLTSSGFCSQNLYVSPCEYLNDFVTQCSLCPSSCHMAHDEKSVSLLTKDLHVQERRLDEVQQHPNFRSSNAMQDWFLLHYRNTSMLRELIQLMQSKDIKKGSIIRLLSHRNEFRITDTEAKTVTVKKIALPCSNKALTKTLASKSDNAPAEEYLTEIFDLID